MNANGESDKQFLRRMRDMVENDEKDLSYADEKRLALLVLDRLLKTWMQGDEK
jgi:hypothetical protein